MKKTFKKAIFIILGIVVVSSVAYIIDASSEYVYFLHLLKEPAGRNAIAIQFAEYSRDSYYYIYKTKLTASLITILTAFALMWVADKRAS